MKLETVTGNVIRNISIPYPPIMEERYKMAETNEIDQSEQSTQIESHPKRKRNKIKYPSSQLYKYFRSSNNLKNVSSFF